MSPFKSTKLGILSNSVKYILDRDDRVGAAITTTSTNHVWSYGDYNYICFVSPGTFTVQRSGKVDYCLVGGGGGGAGGFIAPPFTGADGSGNGGGAGGVIHNYNYDTAEGTYTVVIGGGGSGGGGQASENHGSYGTPTNITGPGITPTEYFTAYGGGGGAGQDETAPYAGQDSVQVYGASGGGKRFVDYDNGNYVSNPPAWPSLVPLAPYRPDGIPQGYPGAVGDDADGGGGGGGAAGQGSGAPTTFRGGAGGNGVRVFAGDAGIEPANTPSELTIGQEASPLHLLSPGRYVGGGGAGGGHYFSSWSPEFARPAGGGGVQGPAGSVTYIDAVPSTGSGGGGGLETPPPAASNTSTSGGNGAGGIVIIRYKRVVDGG